MSIVPEVTSDGWQVRSAHISRMLIASGREADATAVSAIVEATAAIPEWVLPAAILKAQQEASRGFPPQIGDLIEAARLLGQYYSEAKSKLCNPVWYRNMHRAQPVAADVGDPHAHQPGVPRLAPGVSDKPRRGFGEARAAEQEEQGRRDVAAHALHDTPDLRCARCILDAHQDHRQPQQDCFRCQLDEALKTPDKRHRFRSSRADYLERSGYHDPEQRAKLIVEAENHLEFLHIQRCAELERENRRLEDKLDRLGRRETELQRKVADLLEDRPRKSQLMRVVQPGQAGQAALGPVVETRQSAFDGDNTF